MTEPISDEELERQRRLILKYGPKFIDGESAIARIDLERNRADEAVRARRSDRITAEVVLASLHAAEAECERLREINRELVCSHNDLLLVIVRQDQAERERLAALAAPPDPKEPSE